MTFSESVKTCFQKYIVVDGRADRSEYWWFVLFVSIVSSILGIIDRIIGSQILSIIWLLATLIPSITVAVRRFHDRNMSGWWVLLFFIPLIGLIFMIYHFVQRGDDGANRYGESTMI